ncbi:GPRX protein, partial [Polypterus senegalus]
METCSFFGGQLSDGSSKNHSAPLWMGHSAAASVQLEMLASKPFRAMDLLGTGLMALIGIVAILANLAVVMVTFKSPQLSKFAFVCHLCVVDLLSAILLMPLAVVSSSPLFRDTVFGFPECQIFIFLNVCLICASILTVTAISIERYYYIIHPMRYEVKMTFRLAVTIIIFIWIKSVLLASVPLLTSPASKSQNGTNANHCPLDWRSTDYRRVFIVAFSIFCFFLPVVILTVVYYSIFKVARLAAQQCRPFPSWASAPKTRSDSINSQTTIIARRSFPHRLSAERVLGSSKAALTLVITVGQFLLCWCPYFTMHLHSLMAGESRVPGSVETATLWLAYSSFALHPFLYGLLNRQIRQELAKLRRCYVSDPSELGLPSREGSVHENVHQFLQRSGCMAEAQSSCATVSPGINGTWDTQRVRIPGQIPEEFI